MCLKRESKTRYKGKKINTQWGEKIFDPLLILYVYPLTKKWSVYTFNGMFIWTVRDRITHKKESYKLIWILMSQICIWPLCKTWLSTWWQNPCWQSQRSDVSCSWPQVCTRLRRDLVPLLFADHLQVLFAHHLSTRTFSSFRKLSMGLRSGDWLGHSRTLM